MLSIWGRRNSANVQKVLWLADELGLEYRHIPAGGSFGRVNDPDFRALNPNGLVPVIEDDGFVLWESHAILRYLAAKCGAEKCWPAAFKARAAHDKWMDWSQTTLQPAFLGGVFWGFYRTPEAQRNWPAIRSSLKACTRHLSLLDELLGGQPFLGGESLTLADIPAGTLLYRYYELEIERPDLPHVAAWYARLKERKSYRDNVMIPFDELKGRLSF
jgi:glutathione S-transferase